MNADLVAHIRAFEQAAAMRQRDAPLPESRFYAGPASLHDVLAQTSGTVREHVQWLADAVRQGDEAYLASAKTAMDLGMVVCNTAIIHSPNGECIVVDRPDINSLSADKIEAYAFRLEAQTTPGSSGIFQPPNGVKESGGVRISGDGRVRVCRGKGFSSAPSLYNLGGAVGRAVLSPSGKKDARLAAADLRTVAEKMDKALYFGTGFWPTAEGAGEYRAGIFTLNFKYFRGQDALGIKDDPLWFLYNEPKLSTLRPRE